MPRVSTTHLHESGLDLDPIGVPESPSMAEEPKGKEFSSLYQKTVAPLRRYLARMLGSQTEAQDVAHDAYLRVYPVMEQKRAERPEALLYVTARRLAFNRLKRRRIAPVTHEENPERGASANEPGVVDQVIARQELSMVELAIAELPQGCRTVLILRKVEMLSHQEIADRLGIAVSTVEKQHARALRLLRAALPPETLRGINRRSEGTDTP